MLTVVDDYNFLRDYDSQDSLADRGVTAGEGDERDVVDLLIEQKNLCGWRRDRTGWEFGRKPGRHAAKSRADAGGLRFPRKTGQKKGTLATPSCVTLTRPGVIVVKSWS